MTTLTIADLNPPEVIAALNGKGNRRAKYGNRKVIEDGIVFDSVVERDRYLDLKILEVSGTISKLAVHPDFTVLPSFRSASGTRHRAVKFKPDFTYVADDQLIAEDVKAWRKGKGGKINPHMQTDFTIRRKLWQQQHPEALFKVIYRVHGNWHEKLF